MRFPIEGSIDDFFSMKISDMINMFRAGLRALTPIADRALLGWRDIEVHDDWDHLANCLYEVFVSRPVAMDARAPREAKQLPRYEFRPDSYHDHSWIVVSTSSGEQYAFVRLLPGDGEFDKVEAVEVDPKTGRPGDAVTLPLSGQEFLLVRRYDDGDSEIVTEVAPIE
ncbi:hypothetical protein [Streptoalloteichus hindustanus]|uniref:Uncharacterized protein n=1 Tax=Streptoalloteichus hindustanus TaxID=2017 RepID=A0A1M4XSP0_STRHI|nr:hypothetical protein [Streptoalloteichus hindustanus]SHE96594.1 hypothetical protein SAMN05444320_102111 [Streptoalloteichus hindustanus]